MGTDARRRAEADHLVEGVCELAFVGLPRRCFKAKRAWCSALELPVFAISSMAQTNACMAPSRCELGVSVIKNKQQGANLFLRDGSRQARLCEGGDSCFLAAPLFRAAARLRAVDREHGLLGGLADYLSSPVASSGSANRSPWRCRRG
jgi:hypothetical protein